MGARTFREDTDLRRVAGTRARFVIEEIEPRILYSADLNPAALDVVTALPVAEQRVVDANGEFQAQSAQHAVQAYRHEVVFVDTAVPDSRQLIEDIHAQAGPRRQLEVVLIGDHADGIEQIGSTLATMKDVSAVHIIGHGSDGQVGLGASVLNFESLLSHVNQIKGWKQALAPGADLLVYGCDVAEHADGRALIDALGRLTGADVAASENLTGAAAEGGDWNLEYQSGEIETPLAVSVAEQAAWTGLLDASAAQAGADSTATPPVASALQTSAAASAQVQVASAGLAFEQNVGQADASVDYLARGSGYTVVLRGGDALLALDDGAASSVVRLNVVGDSANSAVTGENALATKTNYMIGDQQQWLTNVANYGGVVYRDIYQGIDLRYYGNQQQLEYDFTVKAGADAGAIRLDFSGAKSMTVDQNGDLVLRLDDAGRTISFKAPVAYQDGPSGREAVSSRYVLNDDGTVGFQIGAYDTSRDLVIDPILSYATYFGGSSAEVGNSVATDASGNIYMTGYTNSTGLLGALGLGGASHVFVTKFSPTLGSAIYTSYVGGNSNDYGTGIAVDASGNAYVIGNTTSNSGFATAGAYDTSRGGSQDAFVLKLDATGALVYSTYLGGSGNADAAWAIALDGAGSAYVTGVASSANFPTTVGAADATYGGSNDAYVSKLSADGSTLQYSTFIGGSGADVGYGIARDASGNIVIVGETASSDLATTGNAYQTAYGGSGNGGSAGDAFVEKLDGTLSTVLYSSYLGGSKTDVAYNVTLDSSDKIYLTGATSSSDFDLSANALKSSLSGTTDAFVSVIDPSVNGASALVYSTYIGGNNNTEAGLAIGVDPGGRIYVSGESNSTSGFQWTSGAYRTTNSGSTDAFLVVIDPAKITGSMLVYGTFYGGTGNDYGDGGLYSNGKYYIVGDTASSSIATSGSYDSSFNGSTDAFVAVFDFVPVVTTTTGFLSYVENAGAVALDSGIAVTDAGIANLAGTILQITGNYVNGEDLLGFVNQSGITGTWDGATGTLTLTGVSSVANYQAALRSVTYTNGSEKPSTATRTVVINTSDGVLSSVTATRTIAVTSVNDAPVIMVHALQPIDEDTSLVFSTANGNAISVGDVDAGISPLQVTLTAGSGKLTLSQTTGLTFVTGNGLGNTTMTFTGVLTDINAALDGLRYDPSADFNGSGSIQIVTNDQGNTGAGGSKSAAVSMAITVLPVDDAPVANLPGPQITAQNTPLVFSSANGNPITVSDIDAGSGLMQITLAAAQGSMTLGSTAGLSSVVVGSGSIQLAGPLSAVNAALDGLTFTPNTGFSGATGITIVSDDGGYTGSGGPLITTSTLSITVATDVPPTVATSAALLPYTENDPATAIDVSLTVADPDSATLDHALVRIAANYVDGEDVLEFSNLGSIAGSWDASSATLTLSGAASVTEYQTALRSVTYRNLSDAPSAATRTLTYVVNDGIADGAIATQLVAVTPVNDGPSIAVPGTQSTDEDNELVFSATNGNAIVIADLDAGYNRLQITLTAGNGVLSLAQVSGLVVTAGADGTGSMTFTGTPSDVNAALNGLRFDPSANFNGIADLNVSVDDQGNSGTGGALSSNATVDIAVAAVNDAPTGTDATVTTLEDTPYVFSTADFGFTDLSDAPGNNLLAVCIDSLASGGTLLDNGVAVNTGQFVTATDIAAGKLMYMPNANSAGAAYSAFTFQVQDNGGTVNGGVDLDAAPRTLTIDVTTVNDAPAGNDGTVTALEDTPYVFSATDFGFNDPNDNPSNGLLAVKIGSLPGAGSLTLFGAVVNVGQFVSATDISAGGLTFTGATDAFGTSYANFTFQVQDDGGTANGGIDLGAAPSTITVDVSPVNDAPSGVNKTVTTLEDTPYVFSTTDFGFIDPKDIPANNLAAVQITSLSASGSLTLNGAAVSAGQMVSATDIAAGAFAFSPAANANGPGCGSLTFQVQDDGGTINGGIDTDLTPKAMTIDVTAVNDAPTVTRNNGVSLTPATSVTIANSALQVSDPDNTTAQLVYTVSTLPAAGKLLLGTTPLAVNGTFTQADVDAGLLQYKQTTAAAGNYGFTFTVADGAGGTVGPVTFSISVATPPPAPAPTPTLPVAAPSSPTPTTPSTPTTTTAPPTSIPASTPAPATGNGGSQPSAPTTGGGSTSPTPEAPQEVGDPIVITSAGPTQQATSNTSQRTQGSIASASGATPMSANSNKLKSDGGGATTAGPVQFAAMLPIGEAQTISLSPLASLGSGSTDLHVLTVTRSTLGNDRWVDQLNHLRDSAGTEVHTAQRVVASSVAITGGLSVGYVIWLLRGGLLLSSLLSSLPAWQVVDPMPILERSKRSDEEDDDGDDPLETLFSRARAAVGLGPRAPLPENHGAVSEREDANAVSPQVGGRRE